MKNKPNEFLEKCRVREGLLASDERLGNNGAFRTPTPYGSHLVVIASDQESWDHVSAYPGTDDRCPTWTEMCWLKDLFWGPEETVMQLHPPRSQWVNCHKYTLHLWKPQGIEIPLPPSILVGPRNMDEMKQAAKAWGFNLEVR